VKKDKMAINFQFIQQLVPFLIILLGFVLLTISIWGIVIYMRQTPTAGQKNPTKPRMRK